MRQLKCGADVETIGAAMLSIVKNVNADSIRPLLEKHDLTEIDPDAWYPTQQWLNVMNELAGMPNATPNYVAIGMKIAENVVLPPQLENAPLPMILTKWDTIYQKQHRGGNIGEKEVIQVSPAEYRIILRDLYPDDLSYGVAHGFCRRFLPSGRDFMVRYEDIMHSRDRDGSPETVLLISWK